MDMVLLDFMYHDVESDFPEGRRIKNVQHIPRIGESVMLEYSPPQKVMDVSYNYKYGLVMVKCGRF